MRMAGFVIHLARAEQRRAHAEATAASLPIPTTMLDAVDARTLGDAELEAVYRPKLFRPFYPFVLRREEIACFLSHRKAWRAIVEDGHDAGLIVEDDILVDAARLTSVLELGASVLRPGDYLRFPQALRDDSGPTIASAGHVSIIAPKLPGRRMFMQWVGRDAAEKLLLATEQFDRPVDAYLQLCWLLPVRMLAARPILLREISGEIGGTTIQAKARPIVETVMREMRRPLYRAAVHCYAFRNKLKGDLPPA